MAITLVGAGSASRIGPAQASWTFTILATEPGDVIVLVALAETVSTVAADPIGYTLLGTQQEGTDAELSVWLRVAGASEPTSLTIDWADGLESGIPAWAIYRGVDALAPLSASLALAERASATAISCPSVTPAVDGSLVLGIVACDPDVGNPSTAWGAPATERVDVSSGSTAISIADTTQAIAGPIALTATYSQAEAVAVGALALRPTASGGQSLALGSAPGAGAPGGVTPLATGSAPLALGDAPGAPPPAGLALSGAGSATLAIGSAPAAPAPGGLTLARVHPRRRVMAPNRRAEATVRLRALDGTWVVLGTGEARGIGAQGLRLSANDWGPDDCAFTLQRSPLRAWPDLHALNRCEVEIAGSVVWGGRVWAVPGASGREQTLSVQGQGAQHHLDDDLIRRWYVHPRLTEWADVRGHIDARVDRFTPAAQVMSEDGHAVFGWPKGALVPGLGAAGVLLDLGPHRTAARIAFEWQSVGEMTPNYGLYARGVDSPGDLLTAGAISDAVAYGSLSNDQFIRTGIGTFGPPRRYLAIFLYNGGAEGTTSADRQVRVRAVRVFSSGAWESGGESAVTADDVVRDVKDGAPLLAETSHLIEPTAFVLPDLAPPSWQSPRAYIEEINAYHDHLVGVDARWQLYFRPRPTAPVICAGEWSGAAMSHTAISSGEELYDRVLVEGSGPDGKPLELLIAQSVSLLARQGVRRTGRLAVSAAVTEAAAEQLGTIWLSQHAQTTLRGTLEVTGTGGLRRLRGGVDLHPSEALYLAGERIRMTHMPDPDTGGWGRDTAIASVSYDHERESASLALGEDRRRLDNLLARYGLLAQGVR